jgi:hypothetical protein
MAENAIENRKVTNHYKSFVEAAVGQILDVVFSGVADAAPWGTRVGRAAAREVLAGIGAHISPDEDFAAKRRQFHRAMMAALDESFYALEDPDGRIRALPYQHPRRREAEDRLDAFREGFNTGYGESRALQR